MGRKGDPGQSRARCLIASNFYYFDFEPCELLSGGMKLERIVSTPGRIIGGISLILCRPSTGEAPNLEPEKPWHRRKQLLQVGSMKKGHSQSTTCLSPSSCFSRALASATSILAVVPWGFVKRRDHKTKLCKKSARTTWEPRRAAFLERWTQFCPL